MTGTPEETQPHQPASTSPPKPKEPESYNPFCTSTNADESQPHHQPPLTAATSSSSTPPSDEETKKWGTHVMGAPAVPTVHPDNQKAALWSAADHQQIYHQPYIVYSPVDKPTNNPLEPVIHMFNNWSRKAETVACNVWHHLKTGPSVSEAAWGKVNLSTSTGPVAGTLYLSTAHVAFCSDRPLSFTAPSGQEAWSYYKVMIPLENIGTINPVIMRENPPEKYIQIVTIDGHDFWFMGFVNFEKALHHLLSSVSDFRAAQAVLDGR